MIEATSPPASASPEPALEIARRMRRGGAISTMRQRFGGDGCVHCRLFRSAAIALCEVPIMVGLRHSCISRMPWPLNRRRGIGAG